MFIKMDYEYMNSKYAEEIFDEEYFYKNEDFLTDKIINNNSLLNLVINDKYKKISIEKDNFWKVFITKEFDIDWKNNKVFDLKNKYKFSDIKAIVHNWKIIKYKIKEKIKLENIK